MNKMIRAIGLSFEKDTFKGQDLSVFLVKATDNLANKQLGF